MSEYFEPDDIPQPGGSMGRLMLTVGAPILVVLVASIGFIWWERGAPPGFRPEAVPTEITEITRNHRGVKLEGTAHYLGLKQRVADGEGPTYHLFPLMEKGDTMSRDVHVLVRTTKQPEDLLSFEDLTVEGSARPPGNLVPHAAREAIIHKGYNLEEDFVLVLAFDD